MIPLQGQSSRSRNIRNQRRLQLVAAAGVVSGEVEKRERGLERCQIRNLKLQTFGVLVVGSGSNNGGGGGH